MAIVETLRRLFGGGTATGDDNSMEGTGGNGTASDERPGSYDPGELERPADTLSELGLEPAGFVTELAEQRGGRVPQQAFTEYTDWSEQTISRVLSDLEEEGVIVRIQIGREKLVCLPGETPSITEPAPDATSGSRRSV